mmetsp:Transcript_24107/g.83706  ORF Transcript_24107/g.83706 Transcript_24107/m.83706 type:complete len:258 (-) Transcript_24107:96-869(-)
MSVPTAPVDGGVSIDPQRSVWSNPSQNNTMLLVRSSSTDSANPASNTLRPPTVGAWVRSAMQMPGAPPCRRAYHSCCCAGATLTSFTLPAPVPRMAWLLPSTSITPISAFSVASLLTQYTLPFMRSMSNANVAFLTRSTTGSETAPSSATPSASSPTRWKAPLKSSVMPIAACAARGIIAAAIAAAAHINSAVGAERLGARPESSLAMPTSRPRPTPRPFDCRRGGLTCRTPPLARRRPLRARRAPLAATSAPCRHF